MKAVEANLLSFIKKSPQFIIPIYQRTYSWTQDECEQLFVDILRASINPDIKSHFIGSIVYVENGLYSVSSQSPLLVIDGQQRLTTITLLLTALQDKLGTDDEPFDGFTKRRIRNYYLLNPEESAEKHHKLLLSQTDKDTLISLIMKKPLPSNYSVRIQENYEFFRRKLNENENRLGEICQGLAKLLIIDISLDRQQDNPQLIFESMNSTGKELTQADLIRNYILMGLEPALQTRLYENYWRQMEIEFGQEAYQAYFDAFMRHFLTVKTRDIPRIDAIYDTFKSYHRSNSIDVEDLVKDIYKYAGYYCKMALGKETESSLKESFADLRELKVDTAYPLLLELYDDYKNDYLSKDDFVSIVRLIESYVFRRAICNIPTNSLNKTFASFAKSIDKEKYHESVLAQFMLLPSYRRFPSDDEFKRDIKIRDLYNFRNRRYWMRRIENNGRKERVNIDEYTIEHIMPQTLTPQWQSDLGSDWERVHGTWLNTLGNLTLTAYNSEYSNNTFDIKKSMEGGFAQSPLKLNKGIGSLPLWDENAITARAERLSIEAADIWKEPALNPEIFAQYKPIIQSTGYSIADHQHLSDNSPMRELFESLRKEILALDPNVSEEFLKLYIAYKAETNFVDIVPQAKKLRLTLNMSFNEIDDPKNLAQDVSGKGRWGNGEVEIQVDTKEGIPYALGLIRQSLDKQLGDKLF